MHKFITFLFISHISLIVHAETDPLITDPPANLSELSDKLSAPYIERFEASFIFSGMKWDGQNYDTVNFYNMEFDSKLVPYEHVAKPAIALRRNGLRMYGLLPEDESLLNEFVTTSVQRYMEADRYIVMDNFSSSKVEPDGTIVFSDGPWNGYYKKCGGNGTTKDFKEHIVATVNKDREITCLQPTNLIGVERFRLKLPPETYRAFTSNTLRWRDVYIVVRRDKGSAWKMDRSDYKLTLPVIAESFYAANDKGEILFGANINQSVAVIEQQKTEKKRVAKPASSEMGNSTKIKYKKNETKADKKVSIDINGR